MADLQAQDYGAEHHPDSSFPHVTHASIRNRIESDLSSLVAERLAATGTCRVIEVGGGHGTFTRILLAAGAHVTVTEMSDHSLEVLRKAYGSRADVTLVHDSEGQFLETAEPAAYDVVVFVSVLHHIPDYLAALESTVRALADGGAVYTVQDPLWYPRRTPRNLAADKFSYLAWRMGRGNYARGLTTRWRRLRGVYDESNPADMVEYHVVRKGVDDLAIATMLESHFRTVRVWRYWSTQARITQSLGERFASPNTFSVIAQGHRS